MTSEQLSQNQRKENAPLNGMSCGAGDPAATRPLPLADSDDYDSLIAAADLDRPLSNGWKVYEHQKEAIKTCLRQRRTILAYDMGLGKTIICLLWAKAFLTVVPRCLVVVVCPCTLFQNWQREARMVGILGGGACASGLQDSCVRLVSWAKIPPVSTLMTNYFSSFVLICDEAHAMQTISSARTQAALSLCRSSACIGVILATGTPMKNGRPANIFPLLLGIRHKVSNNKIEFEKRYCNARKTHFCQWDITGASNLPELRSIIGPSLLRKTKEECIEDICQICRVKVDVAIDPIIMNSYEGLIRRIKESAKGQKRCSLDLITELRQLMSLAKVSPTSSHILEALRDDPTPIVVFVWFRETVFELQKQISECAGRSISCQSMTGDISDYSERQRLVDEFQGGKIDILILTYGVGSTGLTLTRGHRVVLLDRPWTPGDVMQAEDRVRRIGQTAVKVTSWWVSGFTYDSQLDALLLTKDKKTNQVIGGNISTATICEQNNRTSTQPKITSFIKKGYKLAITPSDDTWNINSCTDSISTIIKETGLCELNVGVIDLPLFNSIQYDYNM